MNVYHLTTTHLPSDQRIKKERISQERLGGYSTFFIGISPGYPKWQHPLKLIKLTLRVSGTNADVFHCHEPDALLIGLLFGLIKRKKVIYDVHEHWPSEIPFDLHLKEGSILQRALSRIVCSFELFLTKFADGTIAVSESVAERFTQRGMDPIIISNYSLINFYIPYNIQNVGERIVSVAGNMHLFHGIQEGICAIERLINRFPNISLTLIGNIRINHENLYSDIFLRDWIKTTGFLPYQKMYEELNKSSIGLLLFQPHYYNISIGLPNKLFDYMLMGLPVIASDLPEIRRVIEDADCGILVDPADVEAIAEAIDYLLSNPAEARRMGENGRRAVIEKYNWGNMETVLLDFYEKLQKK